MGSATRRATTASRAALAAAGTIDFAVAEELFAAGRIAGDSSQLRSLMTDPAVEVSTKRAALNAVFGGSLSPRVLSLLGSLVESRWSSENDLLAGIEDLGLRAAALSAPEGVDIIAELFAFQDAVATSSELELALGSKLSSPEAKVALVERLLAGKVSPHTLAILRHLVQQPRGRRINALVSDAASAIADQAGAMIANVSSVDPLSAPQLERLRQTLSSRYGRHITINPVLDPELVGGVRVQIGDDVIDDSVSTKLNALRLQLAG